MDRHSESDGRNKQGLLRRVMIGQANLGEIGSRRWMRTMFVVFVLVVLVVGVVNYRVLVGTQEQLIEHEAVRIAQIVTDQALIGRTVYTRAVADQLSQGGGAEAASAHPAIVPLPATYLKLVGKEIERSNQGLFSYHPLSRWNQDPNQGLRDDFQHWAWAQLEAQDRASPKTAIDWQPAWRVEMVNGTKVLRYLRADPASSERCVACHSALEQTPEVKAMRVAAGVTPGKQFELHRLMGAIEADIPIDKVERFASHQAHSVLWVVSLTSVAGLALLGWAAAYSLRARDHDVSHYKRQATSDALTGLGNRNAFGQAAQLQLDYAKQNGFKCALLYLDLDGFKEVNDTLGHAAGDQVLREVGQRLLHVLRESDIVTRYGGDEFLVLSASVSGIDRIEALVGKILDALHVPIEVQGTCVNISASVGVAVFPDDAGGLDALIECADQAMYEAKRLNRRGAWYFAANLS